jgi:hypothetical protein
MTQIVTRRTFLAGLGAAGATAACNQPELAPPPPVVTKDATTPLTVYFTGLIVFHHDTTTPAMKVGLLGHGHETVIVARKKDVDTPGKDLTGKQYQTWNPVGLAINKKDLTYWQGTKFELDVTSKDALVKTAFSSFPLSTLTGMKPELTTTNCQSLLTLTNGAFAGEIRTHKCEHDDVKWDLVKSLADAAPAQKDLQLIDTVKYTAEITKGSFKMDSTTVNFKPNNVEIWVLQIDVSGAKKNPREIKHCLHYYSVVNYSGDKHYPRRGAVPEECKPQADVDPIYCTPAE